MVNISRSLRSRGLKTVAVSCDDEAEDLDRFLGTYALPFRPIRRTTGLPGDTFTALSRFGGRYRNGIPYTAVLDRQGHVVFEHTGSIGEDDLRGQVEPLL